MLFLIIIGRTIAISSLTDNAIVIAVGIDLKTQGKYEVTVHVVNPTGSSPESGGGGASAQKYVNYTATGSTLAGALSTLHESIGLVVSLSHCNVVLISKDALQKGINEEIQNMVDAWYLPLDAVVIATENKPIEVLSTTTPLVKSTGEYLRTICVESASFSNLTRLKIKDYISDYYSKAQVSTTMLLKMKEMPPASVGSNSGSSSGSGSSSTKQYEFDLRDNFVFGAAIKESMVLQRDYAQCLNFLRNKADSGTIDVELSDGGIANFEIISAKGNLRATGPNSVNFKTKIVVVLRAYFKKGEPVSLLKLSLEEREELRRLTQDKICLSTKNAFFLSQAHDADFFHIEDEMYRTYGYKWEKSSDFLKSLDATFETKVQLKRG